MKSHEPNLQRRSLATKLASENLKMQNEYVPNSEPFTAMAVVQVSLSESCVQRACSSSTKGSTQVLVIESFEPTY